VLNHLTPEEARLRRLRAGLRLIDIAVAAPCAPATVRAYEFGAPVRPPILTRLQAAYDRICDTETSTTTIAGEVQR
jgi:hypothetical protein